MVHAQDPRYPHKWRVAFSHYRTIQIRMSSHGYLTIDENQNDYFDRLLASALMAVLTIVCLNVIGKAVLMTNKAGILK